MLKKRLSLNKNLLLHRAVPLTALAAVMAAAIAVTPSIAGSFLGQKQASRIYLTRKNASDLYLRKEKANHLYLPAKGSHDTFLTPKAAARTYVAKAELPAQPLGFITSSSVDFGPTQSTAAVPVPTSSISFEVPETSLVTLTFSGQATCTADKDGVGCPIQLLVDEQPTGEVKSNFALSSSASPAPAPLANTLVTTTVLTAGEHVASVQYAGATNETLKFGLKDWSYTIQAYPVLD